MILGICKNRIKNLFLIVKEFLPLRNAQKEEFYQNNNPPKNPAISPAQIGGSAGRVTSFLFRIYTNRRVIPTRPPRPVRIAFMKE